MENTLKLPEFIDAREERTEAIEALKNIIFDISIMRYDALIDNHPTRQKEIEKTLKKLDTEFIMRMQDFEVLMYDFKKDWDLNYNDYWKK